MPTQASWVEKKVFGASKTISSVNGSVFQRAIFSINRMYNVLRGEFVGGKWYVII